MTSVWMLNRWNKFLASVREDTVLVMLVPSHSGLYKAPYSNSYSPIVQCMHTCLKWGKKHIISICFLFIQVMQLLFLPMHHWLYNTHGCRTPCPFVSKEVWIHCASKRGMITDAPIHLWYNACIHVTINVSIEARSTPSASTSRTEVMYSFYSSGTVRREAHASLIVYMFRTDAQPSPLTNRTPVKLPAVRLINRRSGWITL